MENLITVYPVMLPTEKVSEVDYNGALQLCSGSLFENNDLNYPLGDAIPQHLYFVSDDETKEGDWCINPKGYLEVFGHDFRAVYTKEEIEDCKKIIAATDSSLTYQDSSEGYGPHELQIPQIPESFVKDFVKANGEIDEVQIEAEQICTQTGRPCGMTCLSEETCNENLRIKINNDNTVIINPPKTFTKKDLLEVMNLGMTLRQNQLNGSDVRSGNVVLDEWLKK